jgi:uncharacterized hydantoinase/oxoprolinase family protein
MAIASVSLSPEWVGVMAEYFATMADVPHHRRLDRPSISIARADGRGKSWKSMRRLARMIGCDLEQAAAEDYEDLAGWLAHAQRRLVRRACDRQLSRGLLDSKAPVVGLGVGRFLVARLAAELGRDYRDFAALAGVAPEQRDAVDVCGPAFAVARLASADLREHE